MSENDGKVGADSREKRISNALAVAAVIVLVAVGAALLKSGSTDASGLFESAEDARDEEVGRALKQVKDRAEFEGQRADAEEERAEAEQARAEASYRKLVASLVREHDSELDQAVMALSAGLVEYFDARKGGVDKYAAEALTWRNRFTAAVDSNEYRATLRELFDKHVLSTDEMSEHVTGLVEAFFAQVVEEEERLLANVRSGLPVPETAPVKLDDEAFEALVEEHLNRVAGKVTATQRMQVGAAGVFLAATVVTMTSGPVLAGAGAAAEAGTLSALSSSAATKLVLTILKTRLLQLMRNLVVSEDEVKSSALRLLDNLRHTLTKGSEEAWKDHAALMRMAKEEESAELRERAALLAQQMRARGYLGIEALLEEVRQRNMETKQAVFESMGVSP